MEQVEPRSQATFVYLLGGRFRSGCEPQDVQCGEEEKPPHDEVVKSFWLGRTETTVAAYGRCVAASACKPPRSVSTSCTWGIPGRENHPINCVDATEAAAFCAWIGGRLPEDDEWEYAAKGGSSRIFPWGDEPLSGTRANFCDRGCKARHPKLKSLDSEDDGWAETAPVGSYPAGASADGLLDMAGNVGEWIAGGSLRDVRGGGWDMSSQKWLRASALVRLGRNERFDTVGFRCAR